MEEQGKPLFVGIRTPDELRRNLLESSKSIIESLNSYQRIMEIQREKKEYKKFLKEDIKELKMLIKKLNNHVPEDFMSVKKRLLDDLPVIISNSSIKDIDIDSIHSQLNDIESKLKNFE